MASPSSTRSSSSPTVASWTSKIRDTIRQYAQVGSTVGHAQQSGDLRRFIEQGKKIIISTVQKFRFVREDIGNEHRGRTFAIIIDEAHSSQGGKTTSAMSGVLGESDEVGENEPYDERLKRLMKSRKLLPNASYYAFTATPKNKTLEIFGDPDPQSDGTVRHLPFHNYSMKQAIQEGFILDVLKHYTPVKSYYKLAKTVEGDPEFDVRKARKEAPALRRGARARDPAQGRDHGRPLPRAGGRPAQDRRQGAGDGGHQRSRARNPVLPRHP